MNWFIGLDTYGQETLDAICGSDIDGVVLGDFHCDLRMFDYGTAGFYRAVTQLTAAGKELIYQTPLYLTDRTLSEEQTRLSYLYENGYATRFLVQDVGLVRWMHTTYPHAILIWSRMGRTRGNVMNRAFVSFLVSLGVSGMESDRPGRINAMSPLGLEPYGIWGDIVYASVGRTCYHQYLPTGDSTPCHRSCRKERLQLVSGDTRLSVDGYFLGRRLTPPREDVLFHSALAHCHQFICYASTWEEVQTILSHLNPNKGGDCL